MNLIGRQAIRDAILNHRQTGVPMAIGTHGGLVPLVDPFSVDLPPEEVIEPIVLDEPTTG